MPARAEGVARRGGGQPRGWPAEGWPTKGVADQGGGRPGRRLMLAKRTARGGEGPGDRPLVRAGEATWLTRTAPTTTGAAIPRSSPPAKRRCDARPGYPVLLALRPMSIATSIFLIAVGAIVRYALTVDVSGLDLDVVGLILMIAGFAGLAISLLYTLLATGDKDGDDRERYEDPYNRRGGPPPPR